MRIKDLLVQLKDKTLQRRLLKYFLLFSIIPIVVLGAAFYTISNRVIIQMASTYSLNTMDRVNTELEDLFKISTRAANIAADMPMIQESLRKDFIDVKDRYATDLLISSELAYASYYNEIHGLDVVGNNGGEYKSHFRSFKQDDLTSEGWYQRIVNDGKIVWFPPHEGSFATQTVGEDIITLGMPIVDKKDGKISGVVLVDILQSKILEIINSRLGKSGYFIIMDQHNNIILQPDVDTELVAIDEIKNKIGQINDGETHTFNLQKAMIVTKSSGITGWKLVGIIPASELQANSAMIGWIIALAVIVIVFFSAFIAWRLSSSVSLPIKKMTKLMKKVEEGDLNINIDLKGEDEIVQLGHSFNHMIGEINELMQKVYTEQTNLRKAEFRALQAQINPHFLYNTLDSIIWLARENKNHDIITMISSLTKLFRIGISKGSEMISIEQEIEHVASYLTIQHIRYKNKFNYIIRVDPRINNYLTLKLILQPLVENAIYHGIKMKKEYGTIRIVGSEQDDCIVFEVSDTGIGMNEEELEKLMEYLNRDDIQESRSKGYGIRNVQQRIKIFFGNEYGLHYFSKSGEGTTVIVKIPKRQEGESYV